MNKAHFRILLIFCFLPILSQAQFSLPDSVIARLDEAVKGFKDRYHSPAIVAAVIYKNEIIFSKALGYTDLEKKVPATINSRFPIMSITKTFTATMLMQLMERKVVDLQDDVKKYVPEYQGESNSPGKSGTNLLQLATHTSGLPRNSPADIHFAKAVDKWMLIRFPDSILASSTKSEFLASLKFIKRQYPEYELLSYGDRHYSNLGYSLLGIALERAAKMDYEQYVLKNICGPLKMNNTGFASEGFDRFTIAKGYYYDDSIKNFIKTPNFASRSALYAGGMYSTATDLARYISFQFDNSPESDKILSQENKAMMSTFRIGWKPSFPLVFHEGHILGYRSVVTFIPELQVGWVVLTNTNDFEFGRMNEYFRQLLSPFFYKKPIADLHKYTGTYQLEGGYDNMELYLQNDSLYSTYLKDVIPRSALLPLGNNRFKAQGKGSYNIGYEFLQDESGEIRSFNLGQLKWVKK